MNVANFPNETGRACVRKPWERAGNAIMGSGWICIAPPSNRQAIMTWLFQDISLLYSANEDSDILLYWLKRLTVHKE